MVAFTQNQRDEVRDLGDRSAVVCANAGTKQQTFVLQGSMIGRENKNGPQGDGINEDVSFTLNTVDRHAVYAMTTGSFTQVSKEKARPSSHGITKTRPLSATALAGTPSTRAERQVRSDL